MEHEPAKPIPVRRKAWRALGSIVSVVVLGSFTLVGLFGLTVTCSDDWLFGRDCSTMDELGFSALFLIPLAGIPITLWLIWRTPKV